MIIKTGDRDVGCGRLDAFRTCDGHAVVTAAWRAPGASNAFSAGKGGGLHHWFVRNKVPMCLAVFGIKE